MPKAVYAIRETVTLVWFVDAETDAEASRLAEDLEIRDFDEIDCSVTGANSPRIIERMHQA